jgi:predicted phage tail protein
MSDENVQIAVEVSPVLSAPAEAEILNPNAINVIRILNPFDPKDCARETLIWASHKTLADYFPIGTTESIVSLNGKIFMTEEFSDVYLSPGDTLVICPIPQGGGNSKSILSLVAMIAISVVAPGAAGFLLTGTFGAVAGIGGSLLTAGIMVAGSLLVHSIFAPSQPSKPKTDGTSTSYGLDGAKNTATEGLPVPICYGKFRMAGNIIGLHVDNEGETQTLYMLVNAGEGPVASITDVRINNNPVSDFKEAEVQIRLGTPDQTVMPWFSSSYSPINLGASMTIDWYSYTTQTIVDRLRLDYTAPYGLYNVDTSNGSLKEATVTLEIQYRKVGDLTWIPMPIENIVTGQRGVTAQYDTTGGYFDPDNNFLVIDPVTGFTSPGTPVITWVYSDTMLAVSSNDLDYIKANYNQATATNATVPVYGGSPIIKTARRSAVRQSFDSGQLPASKYEVRTRRTTDSGTEATRKAKKNINDLTLSDEIVLTDINEIVMDAVAYTNTALVGLKIKLGVQLNSLPQVTFMNGGKVVQAYGRAIAAATKDQWYSIASSNPAWIVWDMLTNQRYGGGMQTSRLDFFAFKRWADYCDSQSMAFNGPIDTEMNVWDAAQYVLRIGRAQLVNVGTRWTVVVERTASPVMMFSVANMIQGSYKETWLSLTDRANEVDVTFFDSQDSYKQRTIKVYDPAATTAGAKQRSSAVTLYGCTEYERAYQEGMFMMNLNRFVLKTIDFAAPMEAVACTVGDLILVQHDMPNYSQAGRLSTGSTTTSLNLDRSVDMVAGKTYMALVLHDSIQRYSGTITNIAGNTVFLSNYDATKRITRISFGGTDLAIRETYSSGSVAIDSTTGLVVGQAFTAYDTDVIEEANVVAVVGSPYTITLQAPLQAVPKQYGNWMFGETAKVKAAFRIKSITNNPSDYTRQITALQYDERVYDNTRFSSQHVPVANPKDAGIGQVTGLQMYEESRISGDQIISTVTAFWSPPVAGTYAGADVYVQQGSATAFKLLGNVTARTSVAIPSSRGDTVKVKVVAFDFYGHKAPYQAAPEATYKVIGEVAKITVGAVTGADFLWSGKDCRLTWRYNATSHSYEFGSEPVGADSGALDPQFKDYEIKVWHDSDAKTVPARRTEYVTSNSYTYNYEKNFADGLERRLRFEIRMRDKFNNLGSPATLTAYNPPPTITGFNANPTFESATLSYTHSNDPDFAGVMVWISDDQTVVSGDITRSGFIAPAYDGPDSVTNLTHLIWNHDYYVRIACYDVFGKTELLPSEVQHFKTSYFDVEAIAAGVLSDSKLIPALQARINLVDGPIQLAGSVAARLDAEAQTRATAILNEANTRAAAITTEATTRQSATDSLASQITTLTSSVNNNAAAIQTEQTTRATADTAEASARTTLAARVTNNEASITSESTARANGDSANATSITSLTTTVNTNTANITALNNVTSTSSSASAVALNSLRAQVNDATTGLPVSVSKINELNNVSATTTSTGALKTLQMQSRLDNQNGTGATMEQSFTTQANRATGLEAQYTVKVDLNGYVSGFGLASTLKDGVPTSEFIINADKFAVIMPSYPNVHPFTIGNVNGVPRVIISSAIIGDASVNTLNIQGNAVTIPVSAYAAANYVMPSQDTVQTIFVTSTGAPALLIFGCYLYSANHEGLYMKLMRDTTVEIFRVGPGSTDITQQLIGQGMVNGMVIDNPGAGNHNYTLVVGNANGYASNASARSITYLEVKR